MLPFRTIGWKLPSRFSESYILGYGPSYFTIFFRPILFLFSLLFLSPFFTTLFPSPEMQILRLFELQNAELCVQTKREREEKRKTNKQKKRKDFTKIERDSKNHAAARLSFPSFIFETRHFATVSSNVNDRRNWEEKYALEYATCTRYGTQ